MELWDIYNSDELKTGKIITRGEKLQPNEYHLVVHIWVKDNDKYLIQKRAKHLEWMPNIWTATGGCASSTEGPLEAAIRETEEEVGLKFKKDQFNFIRKEIKNNTITYVYLIDSKIIVDEINLDPQEVSDFKIVSETTIIFMKNKNEFYDYGIDYFDDLFKN